jgi:hypothetical protein
MEFSSLGTDAAFTRQVLSSIAPNMTSSFFMTAPEAEASFALIPRNERGLGQSSNRHQGRHMKLILALLTIVTSTVQARAGSPVGIGVIPCQQWIQSYHADEKIVALSTLMWLQGFLSGADAVDATVGNRRRNIVSLNDATAITAIVNYCEKHPGETVAWAAASIYNSLDIVPVTK